MLSTIIVEDDLMAAKSAERSCSKISEITLNGTFESPAAVIDYCKKNKVDLILLDVQLPEMTGLELLDCLPYFPYVIFTTSREDYAYDAFQLNAVDYIKKPFSVSRLQEAVNKVLRLRQVDEEAMVENTSIFIKCNGKMIRLSLDDILYIEAMGDYIKVITPEKSYIVHTTLRGFIDQLPSKNFIQVHRSFVVNIDKIVDIQYGSILINQAVIPISRGLKEDVMKRFGK